MPLVAITGKTYPVKDRLRALGARWDAATKRWMIDESKAAEAQTIVQQQSPAAPRMLKYGQLWQACAHRRCTVEPVCVNCLYCAEHCTCY